MTGTVCSVATCNSNARTALRRGDKLSFFQFPKDKLTRLEWIKKCYKNDKFNPKNKRICSKHFTIDDFEDAMQAKLLKILPRKLKKNAVPSVNLLPPVTDKNKSIYEESNCRLIARQEDVGQLSTTSKVVHIKQEIYLFKENADLSMEENSYDTLQEKYNILLKENEILKKRLEKSQGDNDILKSQNIELQKTVEDYESNFNSKIKEIFSGIFTQEQLQIFLNRKTEESRDPDETSTVDNMC